jgi:hypothetical protein
MICSLPLLEDVKIGCFGISDDDGDRTIFQPPTSPPLTGTLNLYLHEGVEHAARRLLELPGGVRFRSFDFRWYSEEDLQWMMALVEACSGTLEHIEIEHQRASPLLLRLD